MRARLAPVVALGETPCARCNEPIGPEEEWQLDHKDDGPGWLGPAHVRCNARAGWAKMVGLNAANGNGSGVVEEAPLRWSRRWYDEPPIGTEVFLGGGLREVHVGAGNWSTVAADEGR